MVAWSDAYYAVLAASHARVLYGYLVDRLSAGARQPLIIVELDARSARFGYRLVRRLDALSRNLVDSSTVPFTYVLTSSDQQLLTGWRTHPWLQPLLARGLLDVAHLDSGDRDAPLLLSQAGTELSPQHRADSLAVVANHVLSQWHKDSYYVDRGRLYRPHKVADDGVSAIEFELVTELPQYGTGHWNRMLEAYLAGLDGIELSFPTRALSWMERMQSLSNHGLLLCTDRGHLHQDGDQWSFSSGREESSAVNFHLLAEVVIRSGGTVLAPVQPSGEAMSVALLFGDEPLEPIETFRQYREVSSDFYGPEQWPLLEPLLRKSIAGASLEQLCGYVRLSGWDEHWLGRCLPHLLARMQGADASVGDRRVVGRMIDEVWAHYLPAGPSSPRRAEQPDTAFALGVLAFGLESYPQAMLLFEHSLAHGGARSAVYYNLALCAAQMGQRDRALAYLDKVLNQQPDFQTAYDMRLRVMGGM